MKKLASGKLTRQPSGKPQDNHQENHRKTSRLRMHTDATTASWYSPRSDAAHSAGFGLSPRSNLQGDCLYEPAPFESAANSRSTAAAELQEDVPHQSEPESFVFSFTYTGTIREGAGGPWAGPNDERIKQCHQRSVQHATHTCCLPKFIFHLCALARALGKIANNMF